MSSIRYEYERNLDSFIQSSEYIQMASDFVRVRLGLEAKRAGFYLKRDVEEAIDEQARSYQVQQYEKRLQFLYSLVGENNMVLSFFVNKDVATAFYSFQLSDERDDDMLEVEVEDFVNDLNVFWRDYPSYKVCAFVGGQQIHGDGRHAVAIELVKNSKGEVLMNYHEANDGYTDPVKLVFELAEALDIKHDIKPRYNNKKNIYGECYALSIEQCFRMLAGYEPTTKPSKTRIWWRGFFFAKRLYK